MPTAGVLCCLASAAAFGAMGIFGKLAYDEGVTVATLLSARFTIAALLLWALLAASRASLRLTRRDLALALALGAIGYGAQAGAYFAALERMDASLLALILYSYPVMVTVAAVALGRDRLSARTVSALVLTTAGMAAVLAGAAAGALDTVATVLGIAASVVYTIYILVSQGISGRLEPLVLAALVCTGAATTLTIGGLTTGELRPQDATAEGLFWLLCLAVVSTVGAIALFFAGLRRVGPSAAAILSTLEPVVTVSLAALVFGEALSAGQLAGGALVLVGALLVRGGAVSRPGTATSGPSRRAVSPGREDPRLRRRYTG